MEGSHGDHPWRSDAAMAVVGQAGKEPALGFHHFLMLRAAKGRLNGKI